MQTTKACRTISPECSDTENAQLDFELSQPVKPRIGKVGRAKAPASKAKPKGVQGIIESLADPESALIRAIANALKPHIVHAINTEVNRHISQIR